MCDGCQTKNIDVFWLHSKIRIILFSFHIHFKFFRHRTEFWLTWYVKTKEKRALETRNNNRNFPSFYFYHKETVILLFVSGILSHFSFLSIVPMINGYIRQKIIFASKGYSPLGTIIRLHPFIDHLYKSLTYHLID